MRGAYSKLVRENKMLTAWCLLPATMLTASLPREDHVWITTEQLVRFHNKKFDEML